MPCALRFLLLHAYGRSCCHMRRETGVKVDL
jgi:hypothetical protein